MNHNLTKAIFIVAAAGVLFWLLKPGNNRKISSKTTTPEEQKKNANLVADAYIEAMKAGEDATALEEINRQFEKDYNMRAYQKLSDGKIYVKDVKGNDISLF